jgi:hypothetical protein
MSDIIILKYLLSELKYSIDQLRDNKVSINKVSDAFNVLETYIKMADNVDYDDICRTSRPPRIIDIGPSVAMKKYVEMENIKKTIRMNSVISIGKELDKNKDVPYFEIPKHLQ